MSHQAQLDFVAELKQQFPDYFVRKDVAQFLGDENLNLNVGAYK